VPALAVPVLIVMIWFSVPEVSCWLVRLGDRVSCVISYGPAFRVSGVPVPDAVEIVELGVASASIAPSAEVASKRMIGEFAVLMAAVAEPEEFAVALATLCAGFAVFGVTALLCAVPVCTVEGDVAVVRLCIFEIWVGAAAHALPEQPYAQG
jgi:hypothetical protein